MSVPKESFRVRFPEIALLPRKDWPVNDESILVPTAANVLYQGEFLSPVINSGQMTRNPAGGNMPMAFPVFSLRGDYNVQYNKLVTFIVGGRWHADTWVYDTTAGVINALGQKLTAKLIAFDGANRSILTAAGANDDVAAIVLELPATAGAVMRILSGY